MHFKEPKALLYSRSVLEAQEVKIAFESNCSVVEDIYNMVKGSNVHLYSLRDSVLDKVTNYINFSTKRYV